MFNLSTEELTKQLNTSQTNTFLYILNQIIDNGSCSVSNKDMAKSLRLSVSTIEKHLNKIEKAGLIIRESERSRNPLTLNWETISRTITIPSEIIAPKVISMMHKNRIQGMLDLISTPESHKVLINQMKRSRGITS